MNQRPCVDAISENKTDRRRSPGKGQDLAAPDPVDPKAKKTIKDDRPRQIEEKELFQQNRIIEIKGGNKHHQK